MAISSISNIVKRYLYTTPGYTAWIARLTGLVSIPISMVVWWYTHAGCGGPYPGPFNVPTWWMGDRPLDLPLPPEPVNILIFAHCQSACHGNGFYKTDDGNQKCR